MSNQVTGSIIYALTRIIECERLCGCVDKFYNLRYCAALYCDLHNDSYSSVPSFVCQHRLRHPPRTCSPNSTVHLNPAPHLNLTCVPFSFSSYNSRPPRPPPITASFIMSHKLTVFVLFFFIFSSLSLAIRRGEWRQLSKKGNLGALVRRGAAFPVRDNLRYCSKRTITVPLDGRRDYTSIFNAKMRQLRSLGGGTLKLNRGVYTHSGSIVIPSYVCLIGAGMYRTVLKLNNFSKRFPKAGNIRSFETERVTVMHMTIDGNRFKQLKSKSANYGRYGFFSELTNWLYLYRVRVIRHAGYGFDPHGSKKYWGYYLVIDDCRAERSGLDGFTIDQTVHASITRCVSTANDRHGTFFWSHFYNMISY